MTTVRFTEEEAEAIQVAYKALGDLGSIRPDWRSALTSANARISEARGYRSVDAIRCEREDAHSLAECPNFTPVEDFHRFRGWGTRCSWCGKGPQSRQHREARAAVEARPR